MGNKTLPFYYFENEFHFLVVKKYFDCQLTYEIPKETFFEINYGALKNSEDEYISVRKKVNYPETDNYILLHLDDFKFTCVRFFICFKNIDYINECRIDYQLERRKQPFIAIKSKELKYAEDEFYRRIEFNKNLSETAKNNILGIEYEKSGQPEKAIVCYERNIKMGYSATHSFDRLIKIYRKLKRFEDEKRVLEVALSVFKYENERRYANAIEKYSEFRDEIGVAMETNSSFTTWNSELSRNMCVFNTYNVMEYSIRLEKVLNKINKLKSKTK